MAGSYQRAVRRDNGFLAILGRLWGACQPGAERGVPSGRGWQRRQLFVGDDDESVPLAAMCISNEGRLPIGIHGCSSQIDSTGRVLFTADAYRDNGQRFIVSADEKLSAFLELERVTHESHSAS
jgi:hypothetical protein